MTSLVVYVLSVLPRDAELTCGHLSEVGIDARDVGSFDDLIARLAKPVGALVLTDEAVPSYGWSRMATALADQPTWSDVPIIVCTRKRRSGVDHVLATIAGNITVIETPVRVSTVISATKTALRARRRQYQVRDLLARLEDADRRKDEFLAMLGHELRNPLSAMNLALQLKHMQSPASFEDKQMQILERQMRTLSRIVDDLLDVSRVTLGKIRLDLDDVDVCEVAKRCVQALTPDADTSGVTLRIDAPCPLFIKGDVVRLEQILANLVTNAIKYTPRGGMIEVIVHGNTTHACLSVRDTGIGIDPDALPRMFELFSQAKQGLDRSRGGLGLGLSLVKRLVELHGGAIEARSEGLGKGSTFTVSIPLHDVPRVPVPSDEPATGLADQLRILVVEDNDDARVMLHYLLESRGQHVEDAIDGISGLTKAIEDPPDVMVVDIGLPKIDGYQLAKQVRLALPDPPLMIAVTGYGQPSDRERAIAAGFDEFMVKPIDIAELERVLASTTRRFVDRVRPAR